MQLTSERGTEMQLEQIALEQVGIISILIGVIVWLTRQFVLMNKRVSDSQNASANAQQLSSQLSAEMVSKAMVIADRQGGVITQQTDALIGLNAQIREWRDEQTAVSKHRDEERKIEFQVLTAKFDVFEDSVRGEMNPLISALASINEGITALKSVNNDQMNAISTLTNALTEARIAVIETINGVMKERMVKPVAINLNMPRPTIAIGTSEEDPEAP